MKLLKRLSVRYKLIIPLIALEIFLLAILAWNTEFYIKKAVEEGLSTGAQTAANLLAQQYAQPLFERKIGLIDEHIRWISEEKNLSYIVVADNDGQLVAFHDPTGNEGNEGNIERRRLIDLLSPNEEAFQVRAPIAFDGNLVGEVSIGFSNKSTYDFLAFGRRQAVIIVFVAVLSSCLMIWVLVRAITKPLVNIVKIAKRIADGDLSQIIEPGNGDEIGQLSKSLQDMAAKIKFSQAGTKNQALKEHLRRSAPLAEFGQMAASVANEIRNPLAGISGCSQILKMKSGRDPIRDELLDMILKDVGRLEEVVGRFIEFAHLSGFELQSTQITELLEDPLTLIDDQANVQRVKLERDYQHEETSLVVDGNQLKQALLHVFTNALQAMPHGGHLQIKTMNDEELLCILVSDTGNSITSDMHERIFDPFFTTKTQGVGLGLSIARMIIEKHNGTIHVNNGRDHKKFFRIELPLDHSRKEDKNPMVVGGNKE